MDTQRHDIRIVNREHLEPDLARGLACLEKGAVIRRIWDRDWTVWKPEDREISNRLGWLDAPWTAEEGVSDLEDFAASVRRDGLTHAVVLGMGGSSLAPELFARTFATAPGGLEVEILDTTEPGAVADAGARLDIRETLFLVSSKSGTTAELLALLSFFFDRARRELGDERAGSRFVAVTDPGTPLERLAGSLHFRRVFHGRPDIGGRFSALSAFGLLPAALKGVDLRHLLGAARSVADACRIANLTDNPGAFLGAVLGTAALRSLDKLTFLVPHRDRPLAAWLEQLVAESTGKEGRGIVPVIEAEPDDAEWYGSDRLFVDFPASVDATPARGLQGLVDRGSPLVRIALDDPHALGGHFFLWEFATAVAAHILAINPFDQPDVESTKRKTLEILGAPTQEEHPAVGDGSAGTSLLRILGPAQAEGPCTSIRRFLDSGRQGDYIALLAFLPRGKKVDEGLGGVVWRLRQRTHLPVTIGFGPRYLHSTGQLHKGDGNKGLFFLLVPAVLPSIGIPAVAGVARPAPDFAALNRAQAMGDRLALEEKGRRVMTIMLGDPLEGALGNLRSYVA
jgi:transaldolase/glucose-6-phosphate isomerase